MVGMIVFRQNSCDVCFGLGQVSQETFDQFIKSAFRRALDIITSSEVASELARLAALRDEGVITQEEYDLAADNLNDMP